jgi:S-methylmethionine-dependent homocysteine/selenocysteine methylase
MDTDMSKYRSNLPQLGKKVFLTDGGLETTLIFHEGIDLPHFAAFDLMRTTEGQSTLRAYFEGYIQIAEKAGYGFILESPTWRASADWGQKLGYSSEELAAANTASIALLADLRREYEKPSFPIVVSGCVGPRGDGYDPGQLMSAEEAQHYHAEQIAALRDGGADMICAITMTNVPEAVGVTKAARQAGMPVAISFTLETDGKLPTGDTLGEAVQAVDQATGSGPAYYMINCAHPTHFAEILAEGGAWLKWLRGVRANASKRSHAELDAAPDLDAGDPAELGREYGELLRQHGQITVLGGCCGTDHRHIGEIASACRHSA